MTDDKVVALYRHNHINTETIWIGISDPSATKAEQWKPAYRDMRGDTRVIWARFPDAPENVTVWIKDGNGARRERRI